MAAGLTPSEEQQLLATIEMFEVITQEQPLDFQSLEILKEAYFKLSRQGDVVNTSKRLAQAYVQLGQLSSAILEYESILQRFPDDPDVQAALAEIESKANSFGAAAEVDGTEVPVNHAKADRSQGRGGPDANLDVDDGRDVMRKLFVDGKLLQGTDFDRLWVRPGSHPPNKVFEPFVQIVAEQGIQDVQRSMKLLCEKSRMAYLPLERYDVDVELARQFPREACQRWCVLPFDKMSKCILVATANPFNKQAVLELEGATKSRLLWYLAEPRPIMENLRKAFR